MLKQRIITAFVLIVVLIWVLFTWSQPAFAVFLGVFVLAGAWEWTALCGLKKLPVRLLYLALVAAAGGVLILTPSLTWPLMLVATLWWVWIFVELIAYPDVRRGFLASLPGKLLSGFVLLLPAWIVPLVLRAQSPQGEWLVLYLLLIVWAADTGAYFAGHRWGKTKLAPLISPGKTWEGVAGGLATVLVLALAAGVYGMRYSGLWLAAWVALALVTAFVSVLGDLFESRIKRAAGVKDSGILFPGHGGVLDRIDAYTAAAPLFTLAWLYWSASVGAL